MAENENVNENATEAAVQENASVAEAAPATDVSASTASDAAKADAPAADASAAEAPKKKQHSNLFVRVMSVIVLLPLLLALIIFGNSVMWAVFVLVAAFLGALEYMRITNGEESKATRGFSAVLAVIPAIVADLVIGKHAPIQTDYSLIALGGGVAATVWGAFLFNCFRPREISRASSVINGTLGAALYIGFTFLFLALFKRDLGDAGNAWIFTLMAMTWGSDTGAYFTGRALGKHKMAPILSPKKSIEGAVGGFASAIIAAVIAKFIAFPQIEIWQIIILAIVANFLAQMGDLSESLIKRSHKVKDSGNVIPGHGGVLDRIDALIFSAPWVYGFAYFMN